MSTFTRVLFKALFLYLLVNLLFGLWAEPHLGRVSAYNGLFSGRARFPFGEAPQEAYNFSLFDLEAMFAAHEVTAPASQGEYRVFLVGDSSVWGTLLRPEETLAGQLNALGLTAGDGRKMRFYNLGYPTISLTKDLLIIDRARAYQPDLVVWLVTLEAFPLDKQLAVPLLENNPLASRELLARYNLDRLPRETLVDPSFFERTLIGRRKDLADLLRLQLYGVLWSATGIDQAYPQDYPRAQVDLDPDAAFHGQETLVRDSLAFETLAAGRQAAGSTPLLIVNEPIMISNGANSDIRYNFYYPRAAYDQYRAWLADEAQVNGWAYLDTWDIAAMDEFTNSAIHLTPTGTARLAQAVAEMLGGQ